MVDQGVGQVPAGDLSHTNRLGHSLGHERRIRECRQLDEPYAVRIGVGDVCRRAQREPSLATAASARQREQPSSGEEPPDLLDLLPAANEARAWDGQVVRLSGQ